jgi:hypothetical protein
VLVACGRIEDALNQLGTPEHDRSLAIMPIAFMDAWSIIEAGFQEAG